MMRSIRYLFIGFLAAGLAGQAAHAQSIEALRGGNAALYRYADPNDFTISIKVWGAVGSPGVYEVREGLNLSTLLSLAGGPQTGALRQGTSSTFAVRLYRMQAGGQYQLLTETLMENQLSLLGQDPILKNGDMLITQERTRQRFGWRDGLSILTAIATVVLVVDNAFFE